MSEIFTWECLWRNSCEGCKVGKYVEDNQLDNSQQKKLIDTATAAGFRLGSGESVEEVIERLQGKDGLSDEGVRVAVEGLIEWEDKGCRDFIRPAEAVRVGEQ